MTLQPHKKKDIFIYLLFYFLFEGIFESNKDYASIKQNLTSHLLNCLFQQIFKSMAFHN